MVALATTSGGSKVMNVSNAKPLHSQIAVITVPTRGIGAAIALKIASIGATTGLCGRSRRPLDETAGNVTQAGGKAGHIINISSLAGKNALPNGAAYAASKWGLNGLTYSVAEELRVHNIRVSVVCPGSVNTDLSPHEGKDKKKMLQPDDVAHAVEALVTQAPQSFISEVLLRPTMKP